LWRSGDHGAYSYLSRPTSVTAASAGKDFVAFKIAQAGRQNVITDIRIRLDDPGQAEAVGDGTFAAADLQHLLGCQIDASLPGPS
jgi:hypothetical protein